jgi:hypothetical protein
MSEGIERVPAKSIMNAIGKTVAFSASLIIMCLLSIGCSDASDWGGISAESDGGIDSIDTAVDLSNRNLTELPMDEISTNAISLDLTHNRIENIDALPGMTDLTELYLTDNSVVDLSALSGLTNLTKLNLTMTLQRCQKWRI